MAITSINARVGNWINNGLKPNNMAGRFFAEQFEKAINDPARYASRMLLYSIVSKDLVGCFVYTTQSLHNKKIPDENRGYVAALDGVNGVLMVGGQLFIGKVIDKSLTPKWFGKFYSGTFESPGAKIAEALGANAKLKAKLDSDNIGKMVREYIQTHNIKDIDCKVIVDQLSKHFGKGGVKYELIKTGFGLVVTALMTTALVKRTIVPFISTPLSAWVKDNYMNKKQPEGKQSQWYNNTQYMSFKNKQGDAAMFKNFINSNNPLA